VLENTLVIMMGEFGRTPKINGMAGRDHHGRANCAVLAGAGLPADWSWVRRCQRRFADRSAGHPGDLAATFYTALGIDPNHQFETPDGRPVRLVENGKVPRELL